MKELDKVWSEIKGGSEKAFYILYTLLFANLIKYIRQIVKDLFLAEDIVQETFIKLWQDRKVIHITGSVQAYLYRMAHNMALNKLQHLATAKNAVHETRSEEEWQFIRDTYRVDDFIIENMERDNTDMLIRRAIETLPDKCREVFVLSRYENLSNEEIAQKLNISVNTVRAHIYKALETIRQKAILHRETT